MRTTRLLFLLASLACGTWLTASPRPAHAQDADPAAVRSVRELERCVTEQQTQLARIVRLIGEAEGRMGSSDAAVARDAREAVTTLVQRAHEVQGALNACVTAVRVPAPPTAQVVREAPTSGSAEDRVGRAGGTVQEIHPAEAIGANVQVVSGERVDGRGTVPTEDLRRAVRATGSALDRCYAAYMDRASARSGEVEISFAAVDGSIREVRVESARSFDATFRTCATQALSSMQLRHTSGRSVFAYVLAFGPR